ncbi:MAG TPA: YbaK/EbsC family protein [Thermoleophilaceae bacterium]|jgi:prolyl-tRNA editing enzyme YbaK/EbsC (Cys-tRNA(Pro) deacylase)
MNERVLTAARELGLQVDMTKFERPTRTVDEAAEAVGCQPAKIAKSIVFVADGDPVVVVASGARRVDTIALCEVLDCAEARPASPEEVRAATGFSPGGVPPFSHGLPVVMDQALLDEGRIWAAGGDGNTVFEVDARKLADCTGATVASVGEG